MIVSTLSLLRPTDGAGDRRCVSKNRSAFWGIFAANIRNRNTREAYSTVVYQFIDRCEAYEVDLINVEPMMVAAYVETLALERPPANVKQHPAAKRGEYEMRKATFGSCLAITLTIAAPMSQAVVYELQTNSVIRNVTYTNGDISDESQAVLDEWGLGVGATLSGTYLLDGDSPPTVVIDGSLEFVAYDAVLEGAAILPNATVPLQGNQNINYTVWDSAGPEVTDLVSARLFQSVSTSAGAAFVGLSSSLFSTSGLAIDDTELDPFDFLDLSLWDSFDDGPRTGMFFGIIFDNGDQVGMQAEYTFNTVRVVPTPGAGLLLLGALAGLTSLRCR